MSAQTMASRPDAILVSNPGSVHQWGHRNIASRVSEFTNGTDERVLRAMFDPHEPEEYSSPLHHHNFDQIRYVASGEIDFGQSLIAKAKDFVYFPAGTWYKIEMRSPSATVYTVQTHAPDWAYFPTRPEATRGAAELQELGELDRKAGVFRWPDGRVQDTYEAMWERLQGRPLTYPRPRFAMPCLIHTDNFAWRPGSFPNVYIQDLASFNTIGPSVMGLRLGAKAEVPAGVSPRHELIAIVEGKACYGDDGLLTQGGLIYVPPGGARKRIWTQDEEAKFLVLKFEPKAPSS